MGLSMQLSMLGRGSQQLRGDHIRLSMHHIMA